MQQDNEKIYYVVLDEKSTGPFTLDEVILNPALTPDTLVWKPGIDNWIAAKMLPELEPAFRPQENVPPFTLPQFNTPPYQEPPQGHNWRERTYEEQNPPHADYNRFADNPQYDNQHSYGNQGYYRRHDNFRNDYRPNVRTNWLPWAIVATVVGFFTSCIGAIFGIIGIVQANKANTMYARGYDREGDAANSNARIMTIIGLIFAGIGIIVLFFFGNFFSAISNLSYM